MFHDSQIRRPVYATFWTRRLGKRSGVNVNLTLDVVML